MQIVRGFNARRGQRLQFFQRQFRVGGADADLAAKRAVSFQATLGDPTFDRAHSHAQMQRDLAFGPIGFAVIGHDLTSGPFVP